MRKPCIAASRLPTLTSPQSVHFSQRFASHVQSSNIRNLHFAARGSKNQFLSRFRPPLASIQATSTNLSADPIAVNSCWRKCVFLQALAPFSGAFASGTSLIDTRPADSPSKATKSTRKVETKGIRGGSCEASLPMLLSPFVYVLYGLFVRNVFSTFTCPYRTSYRTSAGRYILAAIESNKVHFGRC